MKTKLRKFPPNIRNYEKIFIEDQNPGQLKPTHYKRQFGYDKIGKPPSFDSLLEYRNKFRSFLEEYSLRKWDETVKLKWLINNFLYKGKKETIPMKGGTSAIVFNVWIRESVGINYDFLSNNFTHRSLATYFKELFPNFKKDNPFTCPQKFSYPFRYITVDFLMFVYQIPERMELLKIAEEKKMSFNEFADYVLDYIGKCNYVDDIPHYEFKRNTFMNHLSYIKYKDNGDQE